VLGGCNFLIDNAALIELHEDRFADEEEVFCPRGLPAHSLSRQLTAIDGAATRAILQCNIEAE
jgi:hypothetical protein